MSHRATRLATLTFAEEPASLDEGWKAIERFRKRLDAEGIAQPLIVPQYGEKLGRLHFHAAMPQYVDKLRLAALWGEGFTDVRRLGSKKQHRSARPGGRARARIVAGYVAGYVARLSEPAPAPGAGEAGPGAGAGPLPAIGLNRRRYSIPKGTNPEPVRFTCWSLHDAWIEIEKQCGHSMQEVWRSPSDDEQWRGPPTLLLMG